MAKKLIYSVDKIPTMQNKVYRSKKKAINCRLGDLSLVQDSDSGLIFNESFYSCLIEYDCTYQNEQAVSARFRSHLQDVINDFSMYFSPNSRFVEIGCGKGYFLELIQNLGWNIEGFDPSYEGKNPRIKKQKFGEKERRVARWDVVILRHVLEHLENPLQFLKKLQELNPGALIYIEVPCLDWIVKNNAFFDFYYEHCNYFRKTDFEFWFQKIHMKKNTFGDQYISLIAELDSFQEPVLKKPVEFDLPATFFKSMNDFSERIKNKKFEKGVWGASSKGVIFTYLMERSGGKIDYIFDINKKKIGKFIPGSGLKVLSPEQALAVLKPKTDIYVMNPLYFEEIRELTRNRFNYILT